MKIKFIFVGRKSSLINNLVEGYISKINYIHDTTKVFIAPCGLEAEEARQKETSLILAKINGQEVVWLLDERGENLSSPALATKLETLRDTGKNVTIVIGGAFGVSDTLRGRAELVLSLSNMVLPHEIAWLVTTEQVYRALEIIKGSKYHHV